MERSVSAIFASQYRRPRLPRSLRARAILRGNRATPTSRRLAFRGQSEARAPVFFADASQSSLARTPESIRSRIHFTASLWLRSDKFSGQKLVCRRNQVNCLLAYRRVGGWAGRGDWVEGSTLSRTRRAQTH